VVLPVDPNDIVAPFAFASKRDAAGCGGIPSAGAIHWKRRGMLFIPPALRHWVLRAGALLAGIA
jgi:hypothetical protein